jgi:hypothetical protein
MAVQNRRSSCGRLSTGWTSIHTHTPLHFRHT